jgi:ribosomal protein S17E
MIDSEEKIYIVSFSFSFTFVKQGRHQRKNNFSKIQAKFRREDLFKKNFEHNKDLQSRFNRQTTKKCYKKEFQAPFNCPK